MVDRVGQQLGNYRLVRLLGQGGFAEVYLGEHIYLDTQAAIKVLQTQLAREDMEQFRLEARTIARLEHPHIVRVLDFGVEGSTPFLVMSYAPNGTLRTRHPKGTRVPLTTVVSYVQQIAPALQYAHEHRLIHRDIKPENLLVGRANEVLLSDFGIALVAQSSRYQSTRDMAGTIAYMAPEQIEVHPRPASDQYALGIVVYEWLSGDRPFHGSFTEIAIKHSVVPPPPLHEKVPTLSPAVEQVVMTALAKDPYRRFGTIQAFATALEQASQVLPAAPVSPGLTPVPPDARTMVSQSSRPTEMDTRPGESLIPTELVTPPSQLSISTEQSIPLSQSSLPTEQSTLSSQTAVPTQGLTQSSQATYHPTELAAPASSAPLPTKMAPPVRPSVLPPATMIPRQPPRRGLSQVRIALFIGLALLVIGGSVGLLYTTITNQITSSAQATSTAQKNATYTANTQHDNATATAFIGRFTATAVAATAQIQNILTQSTSGTPALNDPMRDNSQGVNWDQGNTCYFGADHVYHVVEPHGADVPCFAEKTDFSNFALQVQLTLNNNVVAGDEIGFIYFRSNTAHTAYYDLWFGVSGTVGGGCNIQNSEGQPHLLNESLDCSTVSQHIPNTATIIAKGNQIYIYWNNQYAGMVTNSYLSHGQIGFGSAGYGLNMVVSSVKVWRLS
jgi:serine/threonine protein kinase